MYETGGVSGVTDEEEEEEVEEREAPRAEGERRESGRSGACSVDILLLPLLFAFWFRSCCILGDALFTRVKAGPCKGGKLASSPRSKQRKGRGSGFGFRVLLRT